MREFKLFPDLKKYSYVSSTQHIGLDNFCKMIVQDYYQQKRFPGQDNMIGEIISSGVNLLSRISTDPKEIIALQDAAKLLMRNITKSKRTKLPQMNDATFYGVRNNRDGIDTETHRNALFTFTDLKQVVPVLRPATKKSFEEDSLSIIDDLYEMVKRPVEVHYSFDIKIKREEKQTYSVVVVTDLSPNKENSIFKPYKGYSKSHFYTNRYQQIESFYGDEDTLNFRDSFWEMIIGKFNFKDLAVGSSKKYTMTAKLYSHRGTSTLKLAYAKNDVYVGHYLDKHKRGNYSFTKKRKTLTDSQIYSLMKIYPSVYYNPIIFQSHEVTESVIEFVRRFCSNHTQELFQIALADWFTKRTYVFPEILMEPNGTSTQFVASGLLSPTLVAQKIAVTPNDVRIDAYHLGSIITGRNAGGKTSFIDMIGITLLLVQNGWPTLSEKPAVLKPFQKIHLHYIEPNVISIGKSRYLDELIRIKELLPRLVIGDLILFDEPFTGTSYKDGKRQLKNILTILAKTDCKVLCTTHLSAIIPNVKTLPGYHNLHVGPDYTVQAGGDASSHGTEIANAQGLSFGGMKQLVKHLYKKNE
ncbi:MAG: hypothetical protein NT085_05260 [candidate division SR1 bacterium]|nr:hypothetical protein [candidate division SR1 bacterium]